IEEVMIIMSLGEYIEKLIDRKDLSLRETARRAHISNSYLSQLKNGHNKNPDHEILKRLAKVLDVEYFELLKQTENYKTLFATEVNKRAEEQIQRINKYGEEVNPEQFPDPITI